MRYLLDTDVSSYLIKGPPAPLRDRIERLPLESLCISAVTRAELLYGLKRLPSTHRLQLVVREYLKLVNTLAWSAEAADYYAEIRHQLLGKGRPIGEMDMMIAAHALAAGAVLVTNNHRHFSRIELPLLLEDWMR